MTIHSNEMRALVYIEERKRSGRRRRIYAAEGSLWLRKNHPPHLHLPGDMYLLVQNMMYGQTEILIFFSVLRFVSVWMLRHCRVTSNNRKKTKNMRYFIFIFIFFFLLFLSLSVSFFCSKKNFPRSFSEVLI